MVEQGLDGELDDFDRTHYCNGNPNHCYFYRSCSVQKPANEQLEENKPEKIQVGFFDELSKLDVGESKTFINNHEPRPFYSELTKRGFRYRVKQESEDKWVITVTKESDRDNHG